MLRTLCRVEPAGMISRTGRFPISSTRCAIKLTKIARICLRGLRGLISPPSVLHVVSHRGHGNSDLPYFFNFRGFGRVAGEARNAPPSPRSTPLSRPQPARNNVNCKRSGVGGHSGAPSGAHSMISKRTHCLRGVSKHSASIV